MNAGFATFLGFVIIPLVSVLVAICIKIYNLLNGWRLQPFTSQGLLIADVPVIFYLNEAILNTVLEK